MCKVYFGLESAVPTPMFTLFFAPSVFVQEIVSSSSNSTFSIVELPLF
jgi:hypothetical protein